MYLMSWAMLINNLNIRFILFWFNVDQNVLLIVIKTIYENKIIKK